MIFWSSFAMMAKLQFCIYRDYTHIVLLLVHSMGAVADITPLSHWLSLPSGLSPSTYFMVDSMLLFMCMLKIAQKAWKPEEWPLSWQNGHIRNLLCIWCDVALFSGYDRCVLYCFFSSIFIVLSLFPQTLEIFEFLMFFLVGVVCCYCWANISAYFLNR